ncbi:MAG: hypothetical protein J1E00_06875 [Oscillospiraceae bacterium]|nr:hypothetical protein [Oscillospiraceae bacterium]
MSNTKRTVAIIASISLVILLSLCTFLVIKHMNRHKIDSDQVEKITVWSHSFDEQELNVRDTETFIKLYNKAKYGGKATGEGGTPEYGVDVYFVDGSRLVINQFGYVGHDFKVALYDANGPKNDWYYVDSQDLYEFVSEIITNANP